MNVVEKRTELMTSLEDYLVREFRTLQALLNLTLEERQALSKEDVSHLSPLVEEKEALLDELGQLEEGRKTATEFLAVILSASPSATVNELFPHLDPATAVRLGHLSEGITTLVAQTRDLNHGNQALAAYKVEWLDLAQTYLLNLVQPPPAYYPPGSNYASVQWTPAIDVDHRA